MPNRRIIDPVMQVGFAPDPPEEVTEASSDEVTEPKPLPVYRSALLVEETFRGEIIREGQLSPVRAAFWAKPSCRRCHGRGLQHWSLPSGANRTEACDCVANRMSKR